MSAQALALAAQLRSRAAAHGGDALLIEAAQEIERLATLFAEQWKHPASALYFTAMALGQPTILSGAFAAAAPAEHPPP